MRRNDEFFFFNLTVMLLR